MSSLRRLASRLTGLAGRNREFAYYWGAQGVSTVVLWIVVGMALLDVLTIAALFVAAVLMRVHHVFHLIGSRAIIPSVVKKADLVEANSRLALTDSIGRLAGPALGGALVGWLRAANALAADAVSYALAAVLTSRMRGSYRLGRTEYSSFAAELRRGIQYVVRNAIQRSVILALATANLASGVLFVSGVHVMFSTETLSLNVGTYGAIVGLGSLGAVLGSLFARRVALAIGQGVMIVSAFGLFGFSLLAMSVLSGGTAPTGPLLFGLQSILMFAFATGSIGIATVVQTITPKELLGRVGGVGRFATWGILPLGAIIGGSLASAYGFRPILRLSAGFVLLATVFLLGGPLRNHDYCGAADA